MDLLTIAWLELRWQTFKSRAWLACLLANKPHRGSRVSTGDFVRLEPRRRLWSRSNPDKLVESTRISYPSVETPPSKHQDCQTTQLRQAAGTAERQELAGKGLKASSCITFS